MSRNENQIRILLADDHALFREGVAEIFATDEYIRVVGEAGDAEETVILAGKEKPDIILLDVEMPGVGAEEVIRRITRVSPVSKVVILTMYDDHRLVRSLVDGGAHAYVVKSATKEELLSIVRTVNRDKDRVILSVSRETMQSLEGRNESILSGRELEVLLLAARAMSNAQIASQLYISEGTVKRHLTNIYTKLDVTSRMDAINKAVTAGLITRSSLQELH